jgi:maleate isomerase
MTTWRPDGWDARARIGVLTPHADVGPESELQAMAPPGVVIHATRVPFGAISPGGGMDPTIPLAPVRAFSEPPHLDAAAELLAAAPIHAIAYGFTSARRIALMNPPWFDPELNELGRRYYEDVGLDVVMASACSLPSDQTAIRPGDQLAWALANVPDAAEVLVIGGNGFRSVGAIDALEEDLGRPVVTANQVLLWAALRAAGADPGQVSGYGRLFAA